MNIYYQKEMYIENNIFAKRRKGKIPYVRKTTQKGEYPYIRKVTKGLIYMFRFATR